MPTETGGDLSVQRDLRRSRAAHEPLTRLRQRNIAAGD